MRFLWPNKPIRFYSLDVLLESIGDGWIVQHKYDGHRAIVSIDDDGSVTVYSRHKKPLAKASGGDWAWLSLVFGKNVILDGEMVSPNRLILWDIISEQMLLNSETYESRLKLLQSFLSKPIKKGNSEVRIVETRPSKRYKELLLLRFDGVEGLVFKDPSATNFFDLQSTKEVPSQLKYLFKQ